MSWGFAHDVAVRYELDPGAIRLGSGRVGRRAPLHVVMRVYSELAHRPLPTARSHRSLENGGAKPCATCLRRS